MADISPLQNPGAIREMDAQDRLVSGGMVSPSGEMEFQDTVANGGNPVTLSQLLSGAGGIKWTDLTDTPGTISANQAVFGNNLGNALEFRGVNYQQIIASEPPVTGVVAPGDMELSQFSATQIQVAAGDMAIVVRTTALNVTQFDSSLAVAQTITPTNLASDISYWTASDVGLTGSVLIKEYASAPSAADLRQEALLGVSLHSGGNITGVINAVGMYRDQGQGVDDFWDFLANADEGLPTEPGTAITTEVASTLQLATTDMVLFGKGFGFHTTPNDPNRSPPIAGQNPLTYATIRPDGTIFNTAVTSAPAAWNNAGTETNLTGQSAAVHQVVWLVNGAAYMQLGTTSYANYDTAVNSINSEILQNPLYSGARRFGHVLGVVVIRAGATQWLDGSARFFPITSGSAGGGGVSTYTALTDTPGSYSERGLVPKINDTTSGLAHGKIRTQLRIYLDGNRAVATDVAPRESVHGFRFNLTSVLLRVKTAPSTTALVVDVNVNGVTIFAGSKPTIATGQFQGSETPTTPLAVAGDDITIDIDAGDATWADLSIFIQGWAEPE